MNSAARTGFGRACGNRLVADWSKPLHHMECLKQTGRLCSWGGNGARLRRASSVRSEAGSRPRSHHGALWRQQRPMVYWRAVSSSRSGHRRISLCRLPTLGHASVATTSRQPVRQARASRARSSSLREERRVGRKSAKVPGKGVQNRTFVAFPPSKSPVPKQ